MYRSLLVCLSQQINTYLPRYLDTMEHGVAVQATKRREKRGLECPYEQSIGPARSGKVTQPADPRQQAPFRHGGMIA